VTLRVADERGIRHHDAGRTDRDGKGQDLHTRKPDAERQSEIVGWSMRDHLRAELATSALLMATRRQRPGAGLVHHSDRGVQYACGD